MKKLLIIIGIIIILLTIGLSGCNEGNNTVQSDEEKIIGKWIYSIKYNNDTISASYNFLSNKTFEIITSYNDVVNTLNGTWNITDNKLFITLEGEILTNDYKFSNNNKTLTITDDTGTVVFTKQ